jgi:DNA helicase-2/ATP-dependent DNA helicase PcrA
MEEERRLMYVAVTRARDTLVVTYPVNIYDRAAGCLLYEPSRFLEGMGEDAMEKHLLSAADI